MGQTLFLDCCRYTQFSPYSNHHYRLIFTSGNLGNVSKDWYSHPASKDIKMRPKKFWDLGTRSGVPCASTLWPISTIADIFRQSLRARCYFRKSGKRLKGSVCLSQVQGFPQLDPRKCRDFLRIFQKVYSTVYSQAVTHPSTNTTQPCLTSVIRQELVYSR